MLGVYIVGGLVAFPVLILIAATAAAFGPVIDVYAAAGSLASAVVTYAVGTAIGRDTLRAVIGPRLKRVQRRIVSGGVLAIAAIRLIPIAPFTVVNLWWRARASPARRLRRRNHPRHGAGPPSDVGARPPVDADHQRAERDRYRAARWRDRALAGARRRHPDGLRKIRETILSDATVRVLTWNIHGSFGRNPRFDLARVVALIDRWDPQIVALQEVDSRRDRDAGINPFEFLQREFGEHGIGAKSITTDDGDYGQMLISRWPMTDTVVHDLSYPEREPRRAIASQSRRRARAVAHRGNASGPERARAARADREADRDRGRRAGDDHDG